MAATAVALCSGGSSASAYAEAYSVAISQNPDGCTVLTEAFARAYAQCGPSGAKAAAEAGTVVVVLNDCASKGRPVLVRADTAGAAPGGGFVFNFPLRFPIFNFPGIFNFGGSG